MKEFLEPRLEILLFYSEDILTDSSSEEGGGGLELPDKEI